MNVFVVSIPNESERNGDKRIEMILIKESFCLSSGLKMMTQFLPIPGLKTGMDLGGRV